MPDRPRSRRPWTFVLVMASLGAVSVPGIAAGHDARALVPTAGPARYTTRGVVKSFGPERKYVNIAHEDIDGYMMAMTMSFEPRSASQIAGLAPGDKVRFTFTATDDGRRRIDAIAKE
ncbi:MAG: copper-binding protein [Labilithrix sp.]|nr:copper-binding protein [Labilithrix sp.]